MTDAVSIAAHIMRRSYQANDGARTGQHDEGFVGFASACFGSRATDERLRRIRSYFRRHTYLAGHGAAGLCGRLLGNPDREDFLQSIAEQSGPQSFYSADLDDAASPKPPALGDGRNGERWFEAVGWITAAREASDRFVMMSLGAFYGYQAVRSQRALQLINPMPYKLVCVEPLAEKMAWVRRHMRDNGIDRSSNG